MDAKYSKYKAEVNELKDRIIDECRKSGLRYRQVYEALESAKNHFVARGHIMLDIVTLDDLDRYYADSSAEEIKEP